VHEESTRPNSRSDTPVQTPGDAASITQLIEHQRIVSQYRMAPLPLAAGLLYCPIFIAALWGSVGHAVL
jgi:hypothetical protein